jgi:hypothetical protein
MKFHKSREHGDRLFEVSFWELGKDFVTLLSCSLSSASYASVHSHGARTSSTNFYHESSRKLKTMKKGWPEFKEEFGPESQHLLRRNYGNGSNIAGGIEVTFGQSSQDGGSFLKTNPQEKLKLK